MMHMERLFESDADANAIDHSNPPQIHEAAQNSSLDTVAPA